MERQTTHSSELIFCKKILCSWQNLYALSLSKFLKPMNFQALLILWPQCIFSSKNTWTARKLRKQWFFIIHWYFASWYLDKFYLRTLWLAMLSIQHAMYYILLNILFKKIVRFYVLELRLFCTLSKRCALKKKFCIMRMAIWLTLWKISHGSNWTQ